MLSAAALNLYSLRRKPMHPSKAPSLMDAKAVNTSAKALRDGWYYSGDVMRRDANGFYYFVGTADDMFVCSGENI